jgi:uncharacterized protein YndB with AHSA1/START domain
MPASLAKNEVTAADAARSITATREFDAPRDLVFSLWSSPELIAPWWGPKGFTNTIHEMDFRPGGVWRFTMHGPDGRNYENKFVYREIVRPERIVMSHLSGPLFESHTAFDEKNGKTIITVTMTFESAELRNRVVEEFGAVEGLHQNLEKLAGALADSEEFVMTRVLDAPRDLVFKVWTEPEHVKHWFGPKGADTFYSDCDFRSGGVHLYALRTADGTEIWGRQIYREVTPPSRIICVQSFSDKDGGITRHPMAPEWPAEMLSTVTFEEQDGRTAVTVRWRPINASEAERQLFVASRESMNGGWGGTFENLTNYLETV